MARTNNNGKGLLQNVGDAPLGVPRHTTKPRDAEGGVPYVRAIIFDLDGVICHTDKYHYQAWKQIADRLGIPFDEQINNRLRGVGRAESLEIILENADASYRDALSAEEKAALLTEKNELYKQMLQEMSPASVPQEVLAALKKFKAEGKLLGIGSSSKNAKIILEKIGLKSFFDAVSDGVGLAKSKPDPEVFLRCAQMLKVAPEECLVVEDAQAGIEAAQAAGMWSVLVKAGWTYAALQVSLVPQFNRLQPVTGWKKTVLIALGSVFGITLLAFLLSGELNRFAGELGNHDNDLWVWVREQQLQQHQRQRRQSGDNVIRFGRDRDEMWAFRDARIVADELDIDRYRPFSPGNSLTILPEEPTITFTENFPRLDGATAAFPVYAAMAQALYLGLDFRTVARYVSVSRTDVAYKRLINGEIDIFFGAQPSAQQLEMARQAGVEFTMHPVAREAFVFFVHESNSVESLTVTQIQDIFQGSITNWSRVGGYDERILAFQRHENSGSQTIMLDLVMRGLPMAETVMVEENVAENPMESIIEYVAVYDYHNVASGIGYSFRYFVTGMRPHDDISILAVEGVPPTIENIRDGTYPFIINVYAVTAGSENENTQLLLDWILSDQGQRFIELCGIVPIRAVPPLEAAKEIEKPEEAGYEEDE